MIDSSKSILQQLAASIQLLSEDEYQQPLDIFNGSSMGMHFRHVIEFYQCLLKASTDEVINYDQRNRDLLIENSPTFALEKINEILNQLVGLPMNRTIMISGEIENKAFSFTSSIGRELVYVHEHAVHHMAIIKIGFRTVFPTYILDKNYGVAAATLKYRQQCAQ